MTEDGSVITEAPDVSEDLGIENKERVKCEILSVKDCRT